MNHCQENGIPRWIAIPVGITLGLITLGCLLGSLTILVTPPEENRLFGVILGVILVLGCLWVFEKALRLVLGPRKKGGLFAPLTLRIFAVLFLLLPVAGFFTGYYAEKGFLAALQALTSLGISCGMLLLARRRETSGQKSAPKGTKP